MSEAPNACDVDDHLLDPDGSRVTEVILLAFQEGYLVLGFGFQGGDPGRVEIRAKLGGDVQRDFVNVGQRRIDTAFVQVGFRHGIGHSL